MSAQEPDNGLIRFGDFEFDRRSGELRRAGRRISLQVQPARVLGVLLERAGTVVTRAELRDKVWPSTIHVDFDHGLNNAITRLRHALDDAADAPRFIETVPRIGYCFTHPLRPVEAPSVAAAPRRTARPALTRPAVAVAIVLIAGLCGATYWSLRTAGNGGVVDQELPTNPEAYDAYLRGRDFYDQRSKEANQLSIDYLTRATELAPEFAPAWAALAIAYASAGGNTAAHYANPADVQAPAIAAMQRALELDPDLAKAHLALALVLNHLQPWSPGTDVAIEASFRHAIQLDALDPDCNLSYGNFLSTRGRSEEAVIQFRRALELSPLSPNINSRLGMELVGLGSVDEGIAYLEKTIELDPWQYNAHVRLGWVQVALDNVDAAGKAFAAAERISPNSTRSLAGLAYVAARRGDETRARDLLAAVLPAAESLDLPFEVGLVYVGLKDRENALLWLARAARQSNSLRVSLPWGIRSPLYDWLRDDPRFAAIEQDVIAASDRSGSPDRPL